MFFSFIFRRKMIFHINEKDQIKHFAHNEIPKIAFFFVQTSV